MKPIQPVNVWYNGQLVSATMLILYIIFDNLTDSAQFYWQLQTEDGIGVAQGNLTMDGETYIEWGSAGDINQYAWNWSADQLNLTLINESVKKRQEEPNNQ